MIHAATIIPLRADMTAAVRRDMVELAAELVLRPWVEGPAIRGMVETFARWSEAVRDARVAGDLAERGLKLSVADRLTHSELGELARWLLRRAADLKEAA